MKIERGTISPGGTHFYRLCASTDWSMATGLVPVVQWTGRIFPKDIIEVRFLVGTQGSWVWYTPVRLVGIPTRYVTIWQHQLQLPLSSNGKDTKLLTLESGFDSLQGYVLLKHWRCGDGCSNVLVILSRDRNVPLLLLSSIGRAVAF